MPFAKGRQKTGGRTKGGAGRKSTKLVDQLRDNGFNYLKELAIALKDIKELRNNFSGDASKLTVEMKKVEEIRHFYNEMKYLLPYMAPKLREKEVELTDPFENPGVPQTPMSDEDLLKVMENGTEKQSKPRASRPPAVAAGRIELQAAPSPEVNLLDMAKEQEDN